MVPQIKSVSHFDRIVALIADARTSGDHLIVFAGSLFSQDDRVFSLEIVSSVFQLSRCRVCLGEADLLLLPDSGTDNIG